MAQSDMADGIALTISQSRYGISRIQCWSIEEARAIVLEEFDRYFESKRTYGDFEVSASRNWMRAPSSFALASRERELS